MALRLLSRRRLLITHMQRRTCCRSFASLGGDPRVDVDQEARQITINPPSGNTATAKVIFLHGLGDTAEGWLPGCFALARRLPHVQFVLPTATTMPVSLNMGHMMPAWYDLAGLGSRADERCEVTTPVSRQSSSMYRLLPECRQARGQ
jgi:hypothetical protein